MTFLHEDETTIDEPLVRSLLRRQFPDWADEELSRVDSTGTTNVLYRLGADLCVRLPRLVQYAEGIERELAWLPIVSPHLTLKTPRPVARGNPEPDFPFTWALFEWLPGTDLDADTVGWNTRTGELLAQLVTELLAIDPSRGPRSHRDAQLDPADRTVLDAIASLPEGLDREFIREIWLDAADRPGWQGELRWIHGDLLPSNLLMDEGELRSVIDFGLVGIGDRAADLIPAWSTLRGEARTAFRDALMPDDEMWCRGRGLALRQALRIIPYYRESNPQFTAMAIRTVEEVVIDAG